MVGKFFFSTRVSPVTFTVWSQETQDESIANVVEWRAVLDSFLTQLPIESGDPKSMIPDNEQFGPQQSIPALCDENPRDHRPTAADLAAADPGFRLDPGCQRLILQWLGGLFTAAKAPQWQVHMWHGHFRTQAGLHRRNRHKNLHSKTQLQTGWVWWWGQE